MQNYNVPQHNVLLELLQPVKTQAVGLLYGIGINKAILVQKNQQDSNQNFEIDNSGYNPDAKPNKNGGYDITSRWDGRMSSSLLGMPVMCYIKFVGGDYVDLQGNIQTIPEIVFETVICSLTQKKNIKQTNISGRDGSVTEYIGMGNWSIEIRAIITADAPVNSNVERVNQDGVYPRANMFEIWQLLKAPIAIPIECWFLNQFDINYLIIDDGVKIEDVEGEYSVQRLVIPCQSDTPLIIKIKR